MSSSKPQWQLDLEKNGYAIVKGAVPLDRANAYSEAGAAWLESFHELGFKRDDPSTWDAAHLVSSVPYQPSEISTGGLVNAGRAARPFLLERNTSLILSPFLLGSLQPDHYTGGLFTGYSCSHEKWVWDCRTVSRVAKEKVQEQSADVCSDPLAGAEGH